MRCEDGGISERKRKKGEDQSRLRRTKLLPRNDAPMQVAKSKAQKYRAIAQTYQKLLTIAKKVSAVTYSYLIQREYNFLG